MIRHGGSLSREHGDGQSRADLLPLMYGDEIVEVFRELKSIWDPSWKMNPGKVADPRSRIADLRLGEGYVERRPRTNFHYPQDGGSCDHAALRCVGVGKCRQMEGGTMCPSYRVTKEEMHTTRGRAHLLFEMLRGDVVRGGFESEEVKDALDLCLSCKGCFGDCQAICCGRPLYAFGMLDRALRSWRRVIDVLTSEIVAGTPGEEARA